MTLAEWAKQGIGTVKKYFRREWKLSQMMTEMELERNVLDHLWQLYFVMFGVSTTLVIGSYFSQYIGSEIAGCGSLVVLLCTHFIENEYARVALLVLGAVFEGVLITPVIVYFIHVNYSFVVASFAASVMIMLCLWSACIATRRTWHDIWFAFTPMRVLPALTLWGVICPYILYVDIYDIKRIAIVVAFYYIYLMAFSFECVLKARVGDADFVSHIWSFLTVLPGIFIHISIQMCIEVFELLRGPSGSREDLVDV